MLVISQEQLPFSRIARELMRMTTIHTSPHFDTTWL